jgi:hypothetical protein
MQDELEKHLNHIRQDMDVESPDDQVIWEGIRKELTTGEKGDRKRKLLIQLRNSAAVIVIMLSVGYFIYDMIGERKQTISINLADIDRELGIRENEYRTLVAHKQEEVGTFNHIDNLIIAELFDEIRKLDTIYEQSMKDLVELGYNEQVIHTIFDTYEKKIYLLELIILENNKIKQYETDTNIYL